MAAASLALLFGSINHSKADTFLQGVARGSNSLKSIFLFPGPLLSRPVLQLCQVVWPKLPIMRKEENRRPGPISYYLRKLVKEDERGVQMKL